MDRILLSPPDVGPVERELLLDAFDGNWIAPLGPHVDAFEAEVAATAGVPDALALASGTAGLHLALVVAGVGPGDDVLVPSFTFAATAFAVAYLGARPCFLDSEARSWNLDPALVEEELAARARDGRLPAALITVDLYGQCADHDPIVAACARYGVPVVEDAAEAVGATFNGNKIITTSGGGMLCSNDGELIAKAKHWATQAKDPGHLYHHSELGYNYRLSNVLAAVGLAQLAVLDERVAARRHVCEFYKSRLEQLPGVSFMPEASYGIPNYWLTVVRFDAAAFGASCEDVRQMLEASNIESRRVWIPLHQQPIYKHCRYRGGRVAEEIFSDSLCLPSGSALTDEDLDRICSLVESLHRG